MPFVRNTTERDIENVACGGYYFTIPALSVCAVWEPLKKLLLENLYKPQGENIVPGKDTLPPIVNSGKLGWKGVNAVVTRFKLHFAQIPSRNDALKLAKQYGVDRNTLEKLREDETISNEEILQHINNLPIPEEIRFPENIDLTPTITANLEHDETNVAENEQDGI